MRLDQWLWAVRLCKTRTLAVTAIKTGHVRLGGQLTKPAHEVRPGELISLRTGAFTRTFKVLDSPKSRVGAPLVPQFAEDLTSPEELARERERELLAPELRPRGAGRPTKRDRRDLERFGL